MVPIRRPVLRACFEVKRQFSRFLAVGVLNTLLGYAAIFSCMYFFGVSPELSNVFGYSTGLLFSFTLNRTFTFKSTKPPSGEVVRFLAVFAVAFGANLVVLYLLVKVFFIHEAVSQILAGIVYVAFSYFMNKHFVFH